MKPIVYSVAELNFALYSPRADSLQKKYLQDYLPFVVIPQDNYSNILFKVHLEQKVNPTVLNGRLLEQGEWFHLKTATYEISIGNILIQMQVGNGKIHKVCITDNWENIYTDLKAVTPEELICLKAILTTALSKRGAKHGLLKLHASAVQVSGEALAFIAPSGTGKSTHSKLWLKHIEGTELLNDDEPFIRIYSDKVQIYGAPWSGSTPCYNNSKAQLQGIIHLCQSSENKLSHCNTLQALSYLFESVAILRWDQEHRKEVYKLLSDLLNIISVYHLDCNISVEAVALSQQLLHTPNSPSAKQG